MSNPHIMNNCSSKFETLRKEVLFLVGHHGDYLRLVLRWIYVRYNGSTNRTINRATTPKTTTAYDWYVMFFQTQIITSANGKGCVICLFLCRFLCWCLYERYAWAKLNFLDSSDMMQEQDYKVYIRIFFFHFLLVTDRDWFTTLGLGVA